MCEYVYVQEEHAKNLPPASLRRIMSMNRPELCYIVVGCLATFISGGLQPCFAIIFSGAINVYDADMLMMIILNFIKAVLLCSALK